MNLSQKIGNWFLTETGKKFTFYAAGTSCVAVLFGHFLPHTVLLDQYKNVCRLYRKGISVPLPKKLQDRFEQAIDLTGVHGLDRHLFKPFAAFGFQIFSAGSSYSRYGVAVGLPANFFYDSVADIDKSIIKVNNELVAWESEEGKALLNSLVMSEKAQLYAMAKEIKYRESPKVIIDLVLSTVSCMMAYALGHQLNNRFNFYAKQRAFRITLYLLVAAFVSTSYVMTKDALQLYYEENIDKELIQKNPIFLEGGREFYAKMLQRNVALRKLMGNEGERIYSVLGNENYLFRQKSLPLVHRKLLFEKELSS